MESCRDPERQLYVVRYSGQHKLGPCGLQVGRGIRRSEGTKPTTCFQSNQKSCGMSKTGEGDDGCCRGVPPLLSAEHAPKGKDCGTWLSRRRPIVDGVSKDASTCANFSDLMVTNK